MSQECADTVFKLIVLTGCWGLRPPFTSAKDLMNPDSIVLLVQNRTGYDNMLKLSWHAYMDTEPPAKPHVKFDFLKERTDGLICLTGGCSGPVGRLLLEGKTEKAEEALKLLMGAFPQRLYMEIQRHGLIEAQIEGNLIDWAYKYDIRLSRRTSLFPTQTCMKRTTR